MHARRALDAKAPQPIGRNLDIGPAGSNRGGAKAHNVLLLDDLLVAAIVIADVFCAVGTSEPGQRRYTLPWALTASRARP